MDSRKYMDAFLKDYQEEDQSDSSAFVLLDSIGTLPMQACRRDDKLLLMEFTARMALRDSIEIQVAALRFMHHLSQDPDSRVICLSMILDCLGKINFKGEVSVEFLK